MNILKNSSNNKHKEDEKTMKSQMLPVQEKSQKIETIEELKLKSCKNTRKLHKELSIKNEEVDTLKDKVLHY